MRVLMRQYRDTPMDLADTSLVVAAERLNLRRTFTLDSHFHAYRINGTHPFEVVPQGTTITEEPRIKSPSKEERGREKTCLYF